MRVRRQRLQVAIFPFLSVLLCVLGSLILLMLVLDRKVKLAAAEHAQQERLAARDKRQQHRETEHQQQLAERQELIDRRLREADEIRRAEEERIKKEQDEEVRQHLAQLQVRDEKRQKLKAEVVKLQAEEAGQRQAVAREEAELAALTDDLRKTQERLNRLNSSATAGEGKLAKEQERQALSTKFEAGLHEQLLLLEQVIEQVKDANKKRPPLFYLFPPNQRVPGAGRPPIYLECIDNCAIFQPDNQRWTATDIQSSERFVEEVRRRQAAKTTADKDNAPYVLLLVRPSATMHYYTVLHALQGTDIDLGYELIAEDWKVDFADPRAAPPAEIAANRLQVASAGPPGPRGVAPKIFDNSVGGGPGFADGSRDRPGNGVGTGGGGGPGQSTAGARAAPLPPQRANAAMTGSAGKSAMAPPALLVAPNAAQGTGRVGPGSADGDVWHSASNGGPGASVAGTQGSSTSAAVADGSVRSAQSGMNGGSAPAGSATAITGPGHGGGDAILRAPAQGDFPGYGSSARSGTAAGNGPGFAGDMPPGSKAASGADPARSGSSPGNAGAAPRALLPDMDSTPKPLARNDAASTGGVRSGAGSTRPDAGTGNSGPVANGRAAGGGVADSGQAGAGGFAGQAPQAPVPPLPGGGRGGNNSVTPPGDGDGGGDASAAPNPLDQRPRIVGGPKPVHLQGEPAKASGPRMVGGVDRDWVIVVECLGDGVSLPQQNVRFTLADLSRSDKPLLDALQRTVQLQLKRQPDVRPSLKYRIETDGLGTFYKAAAQLVPLGLPAAAERVLPQAKVERPKDN